MFAIALWDARRSRLLLARDRFGIKPLYYRVDGDELEFASELRALPRGEIDLDALESYLAFNVVPGPLTIFRECRKLPPGHLLIWEDGRVQIEPLRRGGPGRRIGASATAASRSSQRSCASGCGTRFARTSCPTSRSACSSPAGSTRG